jgi:hypothetical protein
MPTITSTVTVGSTAYPSPLTLSNTQTVAPTASAATAVYMDAGTSLDNRGSIQGGAYGGIGVYLSTGTIINSGVIAGGAGSTQGILSTTDGGYGITMEGLFSGAGPATILNSGTILGGAGGAGNNGSAYSAAGGGVYLYGAGTTFQNNGLIQGGAGGDYQPGSPGNGGGGGGGLKLGSYAVLTNNQIIAGGAGGDGVQAGSGGYGVFMQIYSTLINNGTIIGGEPGSGATAEGGGCGVYLRAGVLVNAGTIIAASATAAAGVRYAVRFGVIDAATLAVESGAVFEGVVFANAINQDVLELAGTAPVTLTGIGTEYKYFNDISFANTGRGVISGNSYGLANGALISGFSAPDTIVLDGFAASTYTIVNATNLTLIGDGAFETLDIAGALTAGEFTVTTDHGDTTITTNALCFCAGTRIATPRGDIPVEDLRIGDLVSTLDGPPQPILWIGRRGYHPDFIAGNHLALPVHIARGAIAPGIPARALRVSPGHGIHIGRALIPAWRLINGVTITQPGVSSAVEYLHIEFATHEILLAENCPAESFLDDGQRAQFHNAAEFSPGPKAIAALPRLEAGFRLAGIQRRLARRAGIAQPACPPGPLRGCIDQPGPPLLCGWAQDLANPEVPVCLDIIRNGKRLARILANRYRADLRAAGIGSGCHAFELPLAPRRDPMTIRRASDGAILGVIRAQAA